MIVAPVPVSAFGGASGGTLLWRRGSELFLTAIVKAQVALNHDEIASIAIAAELLRADIPFADPTRALEQSSDYCPPLPSAEVLLVGHACAPHERPVPSLSVRLFVGRDDQSLVDKTLHVYGDRPNGALHPRPFVRMPLNYELSVGGPTTDNPVGRPLNDAVAPPNLVDPHDPWACAGFGPVAASWPSRARSVRSRLPQLVSGVLEIPLDLSFEYFQAAPADQRVATLAGDEWIVIDGMHPERTRFQCQLPDLKARARLSRGGLSESTAFALSLDRLTIDMDRWMAQLTWRGSLRVELPELSGAQVVVGIESQDEAAMDLASETMMLSEDQLTSAMDGQALPWELSPPPPPRKSTQGRAMGGLPFKPLQATAPKPAPSAPTNVSAPPLARAPAAPKFGPLPREIADESTITAVEERVVATLPFEQRPRVEALSFDLPSPSAHSPSLGSPSVPRVFGLDDDDDEDSGGTTRVAPIPLGGEPAALPFEVSAVAPPVPASHATTALPFSAPRANVPPAVPFAASLGPSALADDAPRVQKAPPILFGDSHMPPAAAADDARIVAAGGAAPSVTAASLAGPSALEGSLAYPLGAAPSSLASGEREPVTSGAVADEPPPAAPQLAMPPSSMAAQAPPPAPEPEPLAIVAAPPAAPLATPEEGVRKLVLENIRGGVAMYGMDLAGADLSELDLRGAILGNAKLAGANLSGCRLQNARLAGAMLGSADLRRADLSDADLSGADFSRADLTGAVLDRATLSSANFSSAQAALGHFIAVIGDRSKFVQAKLDGAVFDKASLRDADFSGVSIERASFREANAAAAIFGDARGESAVFDDADITGASFAGASVPDFSCCRAKAARSNWERAELDRASFDRAELVSAVFVRASLEVTSFLHANLGKADLSNVTGDGADFSDADLSGADLRMSKLAESRFENATMVDVNAQKMLAVGARLEGADLSRASLRAARMKGCDLARAKLDGTDLRDADLEGAKLEGVDTSRAKLAGANLKGVD